MEIKQLLGLDVGQKRTGVARASAVAALAEPIGTIKTGRAISELEKLIEKYSIDTVVVGLPRNLHGEETKQTQWVRKWVDQAKSKLNSRFYWQDEALTSRVATARSMTGGKTASVDALAAAIILQDFLDASPAERVMC